MKKFLIVFIALVSILALSLLTVSCGKDKEDDIPAAAADYNDGKAFVSATFGQDYAFQYASVSVKDKDGVYVFLTQFQFDGTGYGGADIYINSSESNGKPAVYDVTVVSGKESVKTTLKWGE